jgi:serine/threonine-protein kinase HipA
MNKGKNRCLRCYGDLKSPKEIQQELHSKCSRSFFNETEPPVIELGKKELLNYAEKTIHAQKTLTGVQPKLSLGFSKMSDKNNRQTVIGAYGNFILKPATPQYQDLPEIESLTMHLAEDLKIQTVPHAMVRLSSGELAYITKRIDRDGDRKYHMEDMCQLSERLTEDKYRGSYEQIAKLIYNYSENPGLDVLNFYEVVLFSFLTGNADMHLKNFSLFQNEEMNYSLAPAYDLVATKLLLPEDKEELALTLNARKLKLKRSDFEKAMTLGKVPAKSQNFLFSKISKVLPKWKQRIDRSFLSNERKTEFWKLIESRCNRIINDT